MGASTILKDALGIDYGQGKCIDVAINLGRLASVPARAGRAAAAAPLLARSEALTEEIGSRTPWWAARRNEETLTMIRDQLGEAGLAEA